MSETGSNGRIIELDEPTCRQLLGSHHIGRIAFNAESSPDVLPVNYVLHEDSIVFRTGAGAKQVAAARRQDATFQVDDSDADRHSGWSIMVRGTLEPVDANEQLQGRLNPFPGGDHAYWVGLRIEQITGRRIPTEEGWVMPTQAWSGRDASDLMG